MSGYFNGLSDADNPTATTNSVAADYARLSAANPAAFAGKGIFDKLFGGKPKASISSATLPVLAIPEGTSHSGASPSLVAQAATPQPAISSGRGLIERIFGSMAKPPAYDAAGTPLVPGTSLTLPQLLGAITTASGGPPPGFNIPGMGTAGDVSRMAGQAGHMPPPTQPSPYGNQRFGGAQFGGNQYGGNQFGGNQYGGNRFGGNQFGASAQPQQQVGPQMAPPIQGPPPPQGFFRGGPLHFMRGGYPDLMPMPQGMPMRHSYAHGGPDYVQPDGQGDGRSDHVDAKLSPGEYVVDAETTSLLGNGDNEAGARKLEQMRQGIRKQKGKALAKGKFSPNAKDPADYMAGAR